MSRIFLFISLFLLQVQGILASTLLLEGGNLGKLPEHTRRQVTLTLKNVSEETVVLEEVRSTCGCMTIVDWEPYQKVLPGGQVPLKLLVDTGRIAPGAFAKSIYVSVREQTHPVVMIVQGEVFTRFSVTPSSEARLTNVTEISQWTQSFVVRPLRKEARGELEVRKITPNCLQANVRKEMDSSDGECYVVTVSPVLPLKSGMLDGRVELEMPGYAALALAVTASVAEPRFRMKETEVHLDGIGAVAEVTLEPVELPRRRHATKPTQMELGAALPGLRVTAPQEIRWNLKAQEQTLRLTLERIADSTQPTTITIKYHETLIAEVKI